MVLSVPLTMLTSRIGAGLWLRRHRLLLTPEETDPPAELAALRERLAHGSPFSRLPSPKPPRDAAPPAESGSDVSHRIPDRVPLPMQAQPPRYLRAWHALGRMSRGVSVD